jgi:rhodanese-related sulfurtransferase
VARIIGREDVRWLIDTEGAQLVDVLGRDQYDEEHIAGAVNLPVKELDATTAQRLDPTRPVITYCHDSL